MSDRRGHRADRRAGARRARACSTSAAATASCCRPAARHAAVQRLRRRDRRRQRARLHAARRQRDPAQPRRRPGAVRGPELRRRAAARHPAAPAQHREDAARDGARRAHRHRQLPELRALAEPAARRRRPHAGDASRCRTSGTTRRTSASAPTPTSRCWRARTGWRSSTPSASRRAGGAPLAEPAAPASRCSSSSAAMIGRQCCIRRSTGEGVSVAASWRSWRAGTLHFAHHFDKDKKLARHLSHAPLFARAAARRIASFPANARSTRPRLRDLCRDQTVKYQARAVASREGSPRRVPREAASCRLSLLKPAAGVAVVVLSRAGACGAKGAAPAGGPPPAARRRPRSASPCRRARSGWSPSCRAVSKPRAWRRCARASPASC